MYKRVEKAFCAVLCILILFAGCSVGRGQSPDSMTSKSNNPEKDMENFTSGGATIISSRNGYPNSFYSGNQNGCYEIKANGDGSVNILYNDYKTRKLVYLSNQPNSRHDDESDTSYIRGMLGDTSVFVAGEKLLVVNNSAFIVNKTMPELAAGHIYSLNLDGSGKKEIASLDISEDIVYGSCIAFDGESIYFFCRSIDVEKEIYTTADLLRVNIHSGSKERVASYNAEAERYFIVGAFGGSLIIKRISNAIDPDQHRDASSFKTALEQQEHEIYLYSIKTGATHSVMKWQQNDISGIVYEDSILHYDYSDGMIKQKNIFTGDVQPVMPEPLTDESGGRYDSVQIGQDYFDNHVFISVGYDAVSPETGVTYLERGKEYAVDMQTAEMKELSLLQDGGIGSIILVAENDEYFFAITGEKSVPDIDISEEGQVFDNERIVFLLSLIKKEDYYNNIPAYLPFEDLVYE